MKNLVNDTQIFESYFKALKSHRLDEITEHTHRTHLQHLLESIAGPKIKVLHEPKREGKFGAPDFKITISESIIGYIENKKIEENLDKILKSEQIKKYQALSDNILLTNYIDWIWIKAGKVQQREVLCFLTDIEDSRTKLTGDKVSAVYKLLSSFFSQSPKGVADAKKLAEALAIRAKMLKDFLLDELSRQAEEHNEGRLYQLFETFRSFVFHELTVAGFADAFAQNLAYGLFLAKLNAGDQLVNLYNAKKFIPVSFELIRELVNFLDELDNTEYRETKWIVEEVMTILNNLDLLAIHSSLSFTKAKKSKDIHNITIKDPYVYFYEDFLAAYDKKLKKAKGVYYTPPPIVNFIVRSIHDILKFTFNIKDGLADRNKVTILDFAAGTGTFLVEVLRQIFSILPKESGKKEMLIREHILKNIFGFEYLIAPYTIAHLKLSQFLKDNDYELTERERLQVFLTNTLAPVDIQQKIPMLPALTQESKQAQQVKDRPILVITGNPPYSKKSKNNDPWIVNLVDSYKYCDGIKSRERQNWYRDDYIKFIRFAQDKMDKVEDGIVGVITNHSFLSNVTMPGMRQSLLKTFDYIYIVNLNGNAKTEATLPTGVISDENVFDIEQGVAVTLLIKKKHLEKKIFYADLWGSRSDKYLACLSENISSIEWKEIAPCAPDYYFIPRNETYKNEYERFFSVTEIFRVFTLPLMTGRDNVTIKNSKKEVKNVIKLFQEKGEDEIRELLAAGHDSRDWKVSKAKSDIIKTGGDSGNIREICYRLFDARYTYYTGKSKGFHASPQFRVCKNMLLENIGLLLPRQISKKQFRHVFCTRLIPDMCAISSATKEANQLFPLYLYHDINMGNIDHPVDREENFTINFRNFIAGQYGDGISGEQIFGFIYAILHSEIYRLKYAVFLKDKFARIPFPKDKKKFDEICTSGLSLIEIHLLETVEDEGLGDFIGKGSNTVERLKFVDEGRSGKLYINHNQYFNNVPQGVWAFRIGGYKVVDKFLKDRINRELTIDDVEKITLMINALSLTIAKVEEINLLTKDWL